MKVIPVLDLMGGQVVRGVAGRRSEYRPIESRLVDGSTPAKIATALVERFCFVEAYVADLDAIGGAAPDAKSYADLTSCGLRLWVDAGIRTARDAQAVGAVLDKANADFVLVAGLETLAGPQPLAEILADQGRDRVVFSLDLKQGLPLTAAGAWRDCSPARIADDAIAAGVTRMIVLDLANVGMQQGTTTAALAREIRLRHPHVELVGGGGVRSAADLRSLSAAGFDAALVASALHDERLTPGEVRSLTQ